MNTVAKIEPQEQALAPVSETAALISMIERAAVNPAVDVEKFARLLELREKAEASFARKAFNTAVALAKGEIGPIVKDKAVDFTTQKGRTNYKYEGFDTIARAVDPILNANGLSYRFRASQDGNKVAVTCILAHRDGYCEETTLSVAEDHSGNKNAIQAIGSAATYLQRYTLKLALGLAASLDDDAQSFGHGGEIDEAQLRELRQLIINTDSDLPKFLRYFRVETLDKLPAAKFEQASRLLKAKGQRNDG
jgi:hypothetical protein